MNLYMKLSGIVLILAQSFLIVSNVFFLSEDTIVGMPIAMLALGIIYYFGMLHGKRSEIDRDIDRLEKERLVMESHMRMLQILNERGELQSVLREVEEQMEGWEIDWEAVADAEARENYGSDSVK